jgi:hypothetical protein
MINPEYYIYIAGGMAILSLLIWIRSRGKIAALNEQISNYQKAIWHLKHHDR